MKQSEFLKALGAQIRRIRKQKNFSQDRVYLEGGFSRGTLSKIENGLVNPQAFTLAKIAQVIGVPLRKLMDIELDE